MPESPDETLMAAFGSEGMGAAGDNMADFLLVMIAFLFVDIFDTSGTLYSVGRQAGYVDENDVLHKHVGGVVLDADVVVCAAASLRLRKKTQRERLHLRSCRTRNQRRRRWGRAGRSTAQGRRRRTSRC